MDLMLLSSDATRFRSDVQYLNTQSTRPIIGNRQKVDIGELFAKDSNKY